MKAYIILFICVTILNIINEKYFLKSNRKFFKILFLGISIWLLCFVAGMRSVTVGTDVNVYVSRLFNISINSSGVINYLKNSNSDILFALTVYIGSIFKDINHALFLIEFMVAFPIFIYAYKESPKKSFTYLVLIFLLTMYCISLNLMRQSIAMSICILSYHYFNNKEYKKAYILLFVACLFHKTALIFVMVYLINYVINNSKKYKLIYILGIVAGSVLATIFMEKIVGLTSYASYIDRSSLIRDFSINSILKKVFWISLACLATIFVKDDKKKNNLVIGNVLMIISLALTMCSFKIPGTGRLGYYFLNMSYFLIIPEIPYAFKEKKVISTVLLGIIIFFWFKMTYVENDSSQVYPYKSEKIEWLN